MSNSRPLAAWMVMIVTRGPVLRLVVVHDQADMLEEGAERLIFLHRAGQLGEVFEPARGLGAFVGLERGGVAGFVEDDSRELGVGDDALPLRRLRRHLPRWGREAFGAAAGDVADEIGEGAARLGGQFVAVEQLGGGHEQAGCRWRATCGGWSRRPCRRGRAWAC